MQYSSTRLRIINKVNSDIVRTFVDHTDDYDWFKDSGPQNNFQDVVIKSNSFSLREEKLYSWATDCPFTMTLYFKDGSKDTFRIHQKHAIDCCSGFKHIVRSHKISYEVVDGDCLQITVGEDCKPIEDLPAERKTKAETEFSAGVNFGVFNAGIKKEWN